MKSSGSIIAIQVSILFFLMIPGSLLFTHCSKEKPYVTTDEVTNITTTSATAGGKVLDDGNADIEMRGVCWSTLYHVRAIRTF